VVVSTVGILAIRAPVFLLSAGHPWCTSVGGIVEISTLVSPALGLARYNCSSHDEFRRSAPAERWVGLVDSVTAHARERWLSIATVREKNGCQALKWQILLKMTEILCKWLNDEVHLEPKLCKSPSTLAAGVLTLLSPHCSCN
jgi:hypothetical protein